MRVATWLFLTLCALYALTNGGHFYASDDVQKLSLLDAVFFRHAIAIEHGWMRGVGGLHYSWFPPGTSLLMLPGWALGILAHQLVPAVPLEYAMRFCVALQNAPITAALVAVLYLFARRLEAPRGGAIAMALALGTGSMLWPYAKTAWSEPAAALGCYLGLYALWHARADRRWLRAAGLGLAVGVALRQELALVAFGALGWWLLDQPRHRADWLPLLLPLLAVGLVDLAYDYARYGVLFSFPNYHLPQRNVIMAEGHVSWSLQNVYQYTLSPNQGLPWYSPVVLAGLVGLPAFGRAQPRALALGLAALLPLACFYVVGWGLSSWAWGLRYTYMFVPALTLPLAWTWPRWRAVALAIAGLGLVVQLVAVVPNPLVLYERELAHHPGQRILQLMRNPMQAPLLLAWRADPALLAAGRALLLENKLPPGDRRERGSQLPDVWWCLALTEAVPHAAVALVVLFLLCGGGLAGWRLARAIAAE